MSDTWQSDWPFRIYERIQQLGFHSATEFVDSRPMVSLVDLADELGSDIAAVQIESLWFREAEQHGRVAPLLGSLLIRRIRRVIPQGWGTGERFDFLLARGWASWGRIADLVLPDVEQDRVWDCLRSLSPEPGWLPVVPHDELTAVVIEAVEAALQRATKPEPG